ncbi:MAG: peptidoglycan DD-metalloendopeptidase family protein [Prevotella sp.]|jgi:septal ring factor EnvC (AmiA/AmiB activator)
MRRILTILLALTFVVASGAQTRKRTTRKTTRTTKTTTTKTQKKKSQKKVTYSNSSIRGLQSQRSAIQKKIRVQEKALKANKADVEKRLRNLLTLNGEIKQRQKNIEGIQNEIQHIDGNIQILNTQLKTLEQQLKERQAKYIKSMRYMARHRSVQDKLMFIFSAKNFYQMYRRLRFVREYAQYQRAQGESVRAKQHEVNNKYRQLQMVKDQKSRLLSQGQQEKTKLESNKTEQQEMVKGLQKQQKTIQSIIADQHKKDAALNAQLDRLVEIEIQKARARAEAEAKRKAAAVEAAKRRAAELARKKAEAEAAARENARRIAEAKAREARLKEEARQAALAEEAARKARAEAAEAARKKASEKALENERASQRAVARELAEKAKRAAAAERAAEARKEAADQAAREAESQRQAAERKEVADAARAKKEIAAAKQNMEEASKFSTVDRMMNSGFEANRGRLPMPITGSYKIVSHFGQYNVEGLKGVTLDNKGINIMGGSGCQARSVYDGEVSAVLSYAGTIVVMVRHGAYISVYCNLKSVSVSKGQKVSTGQALGTVGPDNILQFQLRKEREKLNPEAWLRK